MQNKKVINLFRKNKKLLIEIYELKIQHAQEMDAIKW